MEEKHCADVRKESNMSEQFHLNQEYLLTGRLAGLTEGEIIALGRGLCLALVD